MNKSLLVLLPFFFSFSGFAMDYNPQLQTTMAEQQSTFQPTKYVVTKQGDEWVCPFCSDACYHILRHIKCCLKLPTDPHWFLQFTSSYHDFQFLVNWRISPNHTTNQREKISQYDCVYCDKASPDHHIIAKHMLKSHVEHIKSILEDQIPTEQQSAMPTKKPSVITIPFVIEIDSRLIQITAKYDLETGDKIFQCRYPHCNICFADDNLCFIWHLYNHINKKLLKCSCCNLFETDDFKELMEHKRAQLDDIHKDAATGTVYNDCEFLKTQEQIKNIVTYFFSMGIACPCCKANNFYDYNSLQWHWKQCMWPNIGAIDIAKILFSHNNV